MRWQLNSTKEFLFYSCEPELVVYNPVLKSTHLLTYDLCIIFNLIKQSDRSFQTIEIIKLCSERSSFTGTSEQIEQILQYLNQLELIVSLP